MRRMRPCNAVWLRQYGSVRVEASCHTAGGMGRGSRGFLQKANFTALSFHIASLLLVRHWKEQCCVLPDFAAWLRAR